MRGLVTCHGEQEMARFGADLALALKIGDAVLLKGDLGAGKTTLARALIRAVAGDDAYEVPSPTFTLVQNYPLRLPIAHYDLYRLTDETELDELSLDDALEDGIALIEWPDIAEDYWPETTLTLSILGAGDARKIEWSTQSKALAHRIERNRSIRAFLEGAGYQGAERRFLTGDASARQYELINHRDAPQHILMDAPQQPDGPPIRNGLPYSRIAHLAEDVTAFVAIAETLSDQGFSAPKILASDFNQGLLLISHLGGETPLDSDGTPIAERYGAAASCLAEMHQIKWPESLTVIDDQGAKAVHPIPHYDETAMLIEADLLLDWYLPNFSDTPVTEALRKTYHDAWRLVFAHLEQAEKSLVLRDFHSPNIIWRGQKTGRDRIGLIDFQDALLGPAAYDVASLAQDARVDMSDALQQSTLNAYYAARGDGFGGDGFDRTAFEQAYAIMAAQRAAKILGIFVRLDKRDGKPHYLKHLPRMRRYFASAIAHPTLKPIKDFCDGAGLTFKGDLS